jgi:hypothetical protein
VFDLLSPEKELEYLVQLDSDEALACCYNDERTMRRFLKGERKIGPKPAERIHTTLVRVIEDKLGLPEMTWGQPVDNLLLRVRRVVALPNLTRRREPTLKLLTDDLMWMTLYHPCGEEADHLATLIARAGLMISSALLLYCWAPHAPEPEREAAPRLAASRAATSIRLVERVQVILESDPNSERERAINKQRLAYVHTNHIAMFSEFRADRVKENGGFSTFCDDDVTRAQATAGQALYNLFLLVKPGNATKRALSQSMLSIASRSHQLALAGEVWAALIYEWPPARKLSNPDSGVDRCLADDSDMQWLIKTVGDEYDASKFQ